MSLTLHIFQLGIFIFSINSHFLYLFYLLQKAASLIKTEQVIDLRIQLNFVRSHLWSYCLVEQQYLVYCLVPGLCGLRHLNLGQCQGWVPSHGVCLKSNQMLVGYSYKLLCHYYISLPCSQVIIIDQRFCSWVVICCSPLDSTFLYHEHQSVGVKAPVDFSILNEQYRCCLQQQDLSISL